MYGWTYSLDRNGAPLLPPDGEAVVYGVHSEIAEHYAVDPDPGRTSTLDHIVAATGACLMGTLGGMLRACGVDASALTAESRGDVFLRDETLVLERIVTEYRLPAPETQHDKAERAHALHADRCPVARSIRAAISIETALTFVAAEAGRAS